MSGTGLPRTRRALLAQLGLAGAAAVGARRLLAQQAGAPAAPADTARARLGGEGELGTLSDPTSAGAPSTRVTHKDNDPLIRELELRLKCPCPCGLDIYTCRTTDFTCSYSPEAHREIVAMWDDGKTAQQITDAFIARYGERALMAPKPAGFNLAGYLVPGIVLTLAAGTLVWVLSRRQQLAAASAPAGRTPAAPGPSAEPPPMQATPEELARLERALKDADA